VQSERCRSVALRREHGAFGIGIMAYAVLWRPGQRERKAVKLTRVAKGILCVVVAVRERRISLSSSPSLIHPLSFCENDTPPLSGHWPKRIEPRRRREGKGKGGPWRKG
jgi:hypothetical protein